MTFECRVLGYRCKNTSLRLDYRTVHIQKMISFSALSNLKLESHQWITNKFLKPEGSQDYSILGAISQPWCPLMQTKWRKGPFSTGPVVDKIWYTLYCGLLCKRKWCNALQWSKHSALWCPFSGENVLQCHLNCPACYTVFGIGKAWVCTRIASCFSTWW